MSQDPNQNPSNYPQGQPYESTQAAPPLNGGYGNPSSSAYNPQQSGSDPYAPYPTPSSAYGNYGNAPGYPSPQTTGSNPYENATPYMPQPGTFPQPSPYGSPYPGYQPPQPKKSKTWLWVTLGIVGGVLIIGIIGCAVLVTSFSSLVKTAANTDSTVVATSTNDSTPVSTSPATQNSSPGDVNISPATVGKTNTLQDVDCVVTAVKKVPGDDQAQPKAGDEYIVIHVKITNKSSEAQHYNPLDFKITDSQGKSFTHTYTVPAAYENQLSSGDLNQNASVEGDLVFEVSSSDHTQTFNWDPVANEFADTPGTANWTLNI